MQMYRVKFARKLPNDMVDLGDVLVCSQDQNAACNAVAFLLQLNFSEVEFDVSRVKPSFYQIARREVKQSIVAANGGSVDAALASSATFPGVTENLPEEHWYSVEAKANLRAVNENEAITKLATAIVREMRGEKQKGSCKELDILCDRTELHPRSPAVEQNALYTFRQIFSGGDARTG